MIRFIARQKLRFDIGVGFLSVINFALIVITASDKLSAWTGLASSTVVASAVPLLIAMIWGLGFALDRGRYWDAYQAESNNRNQMLKQIHDNRTTE